MNVLQTPHRALVSDLATEEQQVPMQAERRPASSSTVVPYFELVENVTSASSWLNNLQRVIEGFSLLALGVGIGFRV